MKQGIEIKPKMIYQENARTGKPLEILWNLCVLCMFQIGVLDYLCVWLAIEPQERRLLFLLSGTGCVLTVLLYRYLSRKGLSILLPLCCAGISAGFLGAGRIYYGFFGAVNYMISWWNLKQEDGVRLFLQDQITQEDIQAFSIFLIFLLMAYFWHLIAGKRLFVSWILPAAMIITGCVLDCFSVAGCAAFLTGCFGVWIGMIRRETPGYRQLIWLAGIGACLFGIVYLTGNGQMAAAVKVKEQVTETADAVRYGTDTLPHGDLSKADGLLDGSDETLRITTEQVKNIYLRGFVGSRYEDGVWKELPKSAYKGERSGMLAWLEDEGLIPQNQYAEYQKQGGSTEIQENSIKIENIGADRSYIYMPYSAEAVRGLGISAEEDADYRSKRMFGISNYTVSEWSGNRPGELLYAASWIADPVTEEQKAYVEAENVYADFVYEKYLDVDPQMAEMIQTIFYDGYEWEAEEPTIYAVTERIRDVLEHRASYQEKPETAPEGTDPVSWFLNKSHQGNAVLFASAAVFAYREMGIPARYAEGYLATESRVEASASGTVTLTDKDSHAWVEVYLDGVGWVPIDVTPGFYYDTYTLLQMVQRPQTVSQTAAADNSDTLGNELENDGSSVAARKDEEDQIHPVRISLTVIAVLLLGIVLCVTILEIMHIIRVTTLEERYQACEADVRTERLTAAIFKMLAIYGYQAELGWKVEELDQMLADGRLESTSTKRKETVPLWQEIFAKGEYVRVTELIEKHVYGQETLTDAENRVLYIFAEKLYQLRTKFSFKIRLRMRYFPDWKF